MKRKALYIILGIAIALGIAAFFMVPSKMRTHYYSLAVEQDSLKNQEKALELYKKAAEWGHAEGAYKAGEIILNLCVATTDIDTVKLEESIMLFNKSSKLGYKEANFMLGLSYMNRNKPDTIPIFTYLKKNCGTREAEAKELLGQLYLSRDTMKAIHYLEIAAKSSGAANNTLYKLYNNQNSGLGNLDKANQYLKKGAELGDMESQYILGSNYVSGSNGFNRDSEKGFQLVHECAIKGGVYAYTLLGWCYMTSTGTAQNFDEAVKWIKKGEENGDVYAKFLLGLCYGDGYGVIKDKQRAIKLIKEAANNGCEDAKTVLKQLRQFSRQPRRKSARTQYRYQGPREKRCYVCGGSGYRHGVNMGMPILGRDSWGNEIVRCNHCGGRGYTVEY